MESVSAADHNRPGACILRAYQIGHSPDVAAGAGQIIRKVPRYQVRRRLGPERFLAD